MRSASFFAGEGDDKDSMNEQSSAASGAIGVGWRLSLMCTKLDLPADTFHADRAPVDNEHAEADRHPHCRCNDEDGLGVGLETNRARECPNRQQWLAHGHSLRVQVT
jgi:hypothetical protein